MKTLVSPDALVLAAGLAFILGYLIINQVTLRLLCLTGTFLYIWYYAIAADEPLWAAIWTSVAMGLANLFGIASLLVRSSKIVVPREHKDIFPRFETLPPGDFRDIVKLARRYVQPERVKITDEAQQVDRLFFVLEGGAEAEKKGHSFHLPKDIFIGEVAFLTGRESSATTYLDAGSEVLEWQLSDLQKACKKDRFRLALEALISKDLASKVALAVAPESEHASKERA